MQVLEISDASSLSVNISQYVTITTHLNDVQQEFSTGPRLQVIKVIPFSNSSSKIITGFCHYIAIQWNKIDNLPAIGTQLKYHQYL